MYETEALDNYKGILYQATPEGCNQCNNSGYSGRVPVHEMMTVDTNVRRMIGDETAMDDIKNYCINNQGMIPLERSIRNLVINGVTTFDEYQKLAAK
jgi:type IV pilus assembly protein PilB